MATRGLKTLASALRHISHTALRANSWESLEKMFPFCIFLPSSRFSSFLFFFHFFSGTSISVGFRYVTEMYQVKCQTCETSHKIGQEEFILGGSPAARRQTNSSHFSRGCVRFGLDLWATWELNNAAQSEMRLKSHLFPWFQRVLRDPLRHSSAWCPLEAWKHFAALCPVDDMPAA